MKHSGTDLADIRSGALSESVENGDDAVKQILLDAAETIGTAVGGVGNLLAPDVVVLGGGLIEAMEKLLVPTIRDAFEAALMPAFRGTIDVVPAKTGRRGRRHGCRRLATAPGRGLTGRASGVRRDE